MKLTYIANIRLPTERAHGIQIMSMAEAFANARCETTLVTPSRKTPISEDPYTYYGVENNFKIHKLHPIDFTHTNRYLGALAFHIERISFAFQALRFAQKNPADIFYTRDELTFILFARKKIKVVYEIHRMPRHLFWYRHAMKNSEKIVVISRALKKALCSEGLSKEKIVVAPDGVNIEKFSPSISKKEARDHFNIPHDSFVALYAGLLDEWKGYQTLLEASSSLTQNAISVYIAGGSIQQVNALSRQYSGAIFLGFRNYNEMPALRKAADVLIIPNSARFLIGASYTSPLKLFESMASGVPILASDVPALREILDDQSAQFFKPDNAKSLFHALLEMKNNLQNAQMKAQNARKEVEKYSWIERSRSILKEIA